MTFHSDPRGLGQDWVRVDRIIGLELNELDIIISITAVAFNPGGKLLASTSVDGTLCVWSTESGQVLHIINRDIGFACVDWVDNHNFFAGMEDGLLTSVALGPELLTVVGFRAHVSPLECMSISKLKFVATGAHAEVRVWSLHPTNRKLSLHQTMPSPPPLHCFSSSKIVVTSLHWAESLASNALLISYMHHGIILRNGLTSEIIRTFPSIVTPVLSTSLSPDGDLLAVSNLITGFDIYSLSSHGYRRHILHENDRSTGKVALPVKIVHGGQAMLSGSSFGAVGLWDLPEAVLIHNLNHGGQAVILALADHYSPAEDVFRVATGTAGKDEEVYIQLWQAQDQYFQPRPLEKTQKETPYLWHRVIMVSLAAIILFVAFFARGLLAGSW